MSELWLPSTVEGKYTFPIIEEHLSIIADGSVWKARIDKGGYFAVSDPSRESGITKKSEITLHSNSLSTAHIDNKTFSLYLEDDCDSIRKFQAYYIEKIWISFCFQRTCYFAL